MNDDFGGDTVIKSNLFFKSLLETSDHGPYVTHGSARHREDENLCFDF
jgi:hypothetical protein